MYGCNVFFFNFILLIIIPLLLILFNDYYIEKWEHITKKHIVLPTSYITIFAYHIWLGKQNVIIPYSFILNITDIHHNQWQTCIAIYENQFVIWQYAMRVVYEVITYKLSRFISMSQLHCYIHACCRWIWMYNYSFYFFY